MKIKPMTCEAKCIETVLEAHLDPRGGALPRLTNRAVAKTLVAQASNHLLKSLGHQRAVEQGHIDEPNKERLHIP